MQERPRKSVKTCGNTIWELKWEMFGQFNFNNAI